ncbi:hypothetical protein [Streptomyces sp. NPDC018347]|uniref:hypothetical protein n=1 Tax=Streptomyces sp. NPDC018347 TaxID=3157193 RepID=UPI0033DF5EE7
MSSPALAGSMAAACSGQRTVRLDGVSGRRYGAPRGEGTPGRRPFPRRGGRPPGVVGSGDVQQLGGVEADLEAGQEVHFHGLPAGRGGGDRLVDRARRFGTGADQLGQGGDQPRVAASAGGEVQTVRYRRVRHPFYGGLRLPASWAAGAGHRISGGPA